jgi:hypothetical protein
MAGHTNFSGRTKIRIQQYLALRALNNGEIPDRMERKELASWVASVATLLELKELRDLLNHLYCEIRENQEALEVLNQKRLVGLVHTPKVNGLRFKDDD